MDAKFYKGRGNDVVMTLTNNGVAVPPASVAKVEVRFGTYSFDSAANPSLFAFESAGIRLKFGAMDAPAGLHAMTLIIYSADHPGGVVWGDPLNIKLEEV